MSIYRRDLPKVLAAYMAIIGLVCGIVYSVGGAIHDLGTTGLNWGSGLAFLAILGMPLMGGVAGLLFGFALARPVMALLKRMHRTNVH